MNDNMSRYKDDLVISALRELEWLIDLLTGKNRSYGFETEAWRDEIDATVEGFCTCVECWTWA